MKQETYRKIISNLALEQVVLHIPKRMKTQNKTQYLYEFTHYSQTVSFVNNIALGYTQHAHIAKKEKSHALNTIHSPSFLLYRMWAMGGLSFAPTSSDSELNGNQFADFLTGELFLYIQQAGFADFRSIFVADFRLNVLMFP